MSTLYVKIKAELGYGPGLFVVRRQDEQHYTLYHKAHNEFRIYKAHTYVDRECRAASARAAQLIGVKDTSKKRSRK